MAGLQRGRCWRVSGEGDYLEGEARVNFLLSKIADLRGVYMQLKQEVASIDRRRKRHRKKQRLQGEYMQSRGSSLIVCAFRLL